MSLHEDHVIECPSCQQSSEVRVWHSVNTKLDPQARDDLLNGRLLLFQCPHCGAAGTIPVPLLYHDPQLKIMVQLSHDGSTPDEAGINVPIENGIDLSDYRFRIVDSLDELTEKIRIFEAGADDRIMEIFKAYQQQHDRKAAFPVNCSVLFAGFMNEGKKPEIVLGVLTDSECKYVSFAARKYEAVHKNMIALVEIDERESAPQPTWRRINSVYARHMLHYDNPA